MNSEDLNTEQRNRYSKVLVINSHIKTLIGSDTDIKPFTKQLMTELIKALQNRPPLILKNGVTINI